MIIRMIMYTRLWPIGANAFVDQARVKNVDQNQVKSSGNVDITELSVTRRPYR